MDTQRHKPVGDGAAALTMYSELLIAAMADESRVGEPGELLARLLNARRRLLSISEAKLGAVGDMATNLAYDLALLHLCESRGIDCAPHRYTQVLAERRRLEAKLAETGIDVAGLTPN